MRRATARVVFVAALALALAAGCDRPAGEQAKASASAAPPPAMTLEEQLDGLVRGLAVCNITLEAEIEQGCPGAVALNAWATENERWLSNSPERVVLVGLRYLKDRSPAVRKGAVRLATRNTKPDEAAKKALLDLAGAEKEPTVLAALAEAVAGYREDPAWRAVLVGMLDHTHVRVRREAASALVPNRAPPSDATRDATLAALASGKDDVRRRICERLRVGDEPALLAAVTRILDADDTPANVMDSCLYGLALSAFGEGVVPHSRAAYDRWLKCLSSCPRDARHEMGLALSVTGKAIEVPAKGAHADRKLPAFVDVPAVERLIIAIAKDEKAAPSLRSSAISALGSIDDAMEKTGLSLERIAEISKAATER